MKIKNVLWIIMMTFFITLAYLLFDRGLNVRTKFLVNYQENNDVIYKVFLHKNDIYNKDYLDMDERYISSLVDEKNTSLNAYLKHISKFSLPSTPLKKFLGNLGFSFSYSFSNISNTYFSFLYGKIFGYR